MQEPVQLHCSPAAANRLQITGRDISQLKAKLPGWVTHTKKGELRMEKSFQFKGWRHRLACSNRAAQLANKEDHHPAILTERGKVTVTWWTHEIRGLHMNNFSMAAKTGQAYGMSS